MAEKHKQVKVPSFFKPSYSAAVFEKKILKQLFITSDREFMDTLYTAQGGLRVRPETVPAADAKRLKALAKAIKLNAGPFISVPKVTLVLLVLGGLVLFNLVFKNALLEQGLEAALSSAFNAKAEVSGLDFDIFGARLVIGYCEVANSREPMRNLFELTETRIDIDFNQLLRGKVILEDVRCEKIRWDTPRKFSGALAAQGAQAQQPEPRAPVPDTGTLLAELVRDVDAAGILEWEQEKLKSPVLLNTANKTLAEIDTRLQTETADFGKRVGELEKSMREIQAVNTGTLKDPLSIKRTLETVTGTYRSVTEVIAQGQKLNNTITTDVKAVNALAGEVRLAIAADKAHLRSLLDVKSGKAFNIAAEAVQNYLQSGLGALYGYALTALQAARQLKDSGPQQPAALAKLPEIKRSAGVFVGFPVTQYPEFLIQHLGTSLAAGDNTDTFTLDLQDITNNPDAWHKPVTFRSSALFEGKTLKLQGVLDLRQDVKNLLSAAAELANVDFTLGPALAFVDVNDVTGSADMRIDFSIDRQNRCSGRCELALHTLALSLAETDSLAGRLIRDTVTGHKNITARVDFAGDEQGQLILQATTNLDRLLAGKLDTVVAALAEEAGQTLEKALAERTGAASSKNTDLQNTIRTHAKAVEQYRNQLDTYKKQLDQKQKELEKKLAELGTGLIPGLDKNLPKLPGF